MQLKREHAAWLAGLIDGEGSIMLIERRSDPRKTFGSGWRAVVSISNTKTALMDALTERIGCGQVYKHIREFGSRKLPAYTWRLNAAQIRVILPQLLPWLVLKQQQAELLLEALAIASSNRDVLGRRHEYRGRERYQQIHTEIKQLNRTGVDRDV